MPVPLRVLVPRTILFVLAAAFVVAGPIWKQGLGKRAPYLFQWVMFSGFGTDVCDVRYVEVEGETRTPVDRYAVLGVEKADAPSSVRKIKDKAAAEALGKRLCRKLPEGTDLRMRVRCATRKGWRTDARTETNLCAKR